LTTQDNLRRLDQSPKGDFALFYVQFTFEA
jgi:hypothetical protein